MNKATRSFLSQIKFNIWKIKEKTFLRHYIKHLKCSEILYSKMAGNRQEMDIPEKKENN